MIVERIVVGVVVGSFSEAIRDHGGRYERETSQVHHNPKLGRKWTKKNVKPALLFGKQCKLYTVEDGLEQ